jgi:hypothetical protein
LLYAYFQTLNFYKKTYALLFALCDLLVKSVLEISTQFNLDPSRDLVDEKFGNMVEICQLFSSLFTGFMEGIIKLTTFDLDFVNVEIKLN